MTDQREAIARRISRGMQANSALEFLTPALDEIRSAYVERMGQIVAKEPWELEKIKALVMAQRVVDAVRQQILAVVMDGESAKRDLAHIEKISSIPEAKRRILGI